MAAGSTDQQEHPLLPTSSAGQHRHRQRSSSRKGKQQTPQPAAAEPSAPELCAGFVVLVFFIIGCVHFYRHICPRIFGPFDPVEYSVSIAAVSGLDPATDLSTPAAAALLNPEFNLTLRVASASNACHRECVEPGTAVEVSYLRSRLPLASGPAPAFCVEVGETREEGSVVAWGDGVRLPGFVVDDLAAACAL